MGGDALRPRFSVADHASQTIYFVHIRAQRLGQEDEQPSTCSLAEYGELKLYLQSREAYQFLVVDPINGGRLNVGRIARDRAPLT